MHTEARYDGWATVSFPVATRNDLRSAAGGSAGAWRLEDVVARAVALNPDVAVALARRTEAEAAIGVAQSALRPQLNLRGARGPGVSGEGRKIFDADAWKPPAMFSDPRTELGVSGRMLLYDFGQARGEVERSQWSFEAAGERASDAAFEIALVAAGVYLKVQEQRELEEIYKANLVDLEKLAALVRASQQNSNATLADVSRIDERLSEARTALADIQLQLANANDEFKRYVHEPPGKLHVVPNLRGLLPPTVLAALGRLRLENPGLLAQERAINAARAERAALRGGSLPKIEVEVGGQATQKDGEGTASLDGKALVSVTQKLTDGGLNASLIEQASARIVAETSRYQAEYERLEAELRQSYLVIYSADQKENSISSSVESSAKARELYGEQFKGGKRSLLELLDVQAAYVSARRTAVLNQNSGRRAALRILRILGRLHPQGLAGNPKH